MVLIEALAAKVPVISSDTGGGVEVEGRNEQIFKIGDVNGCRELMLSFMDMNSTEKEELIDFAYQRLMERFSQEAFKEIFWSHEFVNQILEDKRAK
jgi:hypothetical protein